MMHTQPNTPPATHLKIIEVNTQSLIRLQRRHYLQDFIKTHKPDMMLLCETHLKHALSIKRFCIVRSDISGQGTVGTAIVIRDNIKHNQINTTNWQLTSLECTAVLVHTTRGKMCVIACYRSALRYTHIHEDIEKIVNICDTNQWTMIIGGDFNAKHPRWNNTSTCAHGTKLDQWLTNFGVQYNVHIEHPLDATFHRGTHSSILDFFIISSDINVQYPTATPTNLQVIDYDSDHQAVLLTIILNSQLTQRDRQACRNYKETNWTHFRMQLNATFRSVHVPSIRNMSTVEMDNKLLEINTAIMSTMDTVIPTTTVQSSSLTILPNDLLHLIQQKKQMRRRWQRNRLTPDGNQLKNDLKLLNKIIDDRMTIHKNEVWTKTLSAIKPGPDAFKKIKSICKLNTFKSPSSMIDPTTGLHQSCPEEVAKILGNNFSAVHTQNLHLGDPIFTEEVNSSTHLQLNHHAPRVYFNIAESADSTVFNRNRHLISVKDLQAILKSRANKKSTGHDGIPNIVLRKLTPYCITKIATLFNQLYNVCHFPPTWKHAIVIPIAKPGKPPDNPTSYRPISLLPCLSKVYEKALKNIIDTHCEDHHILPDDQFGFRPHRSTTQPLVILRTHVAHAFNNKTPTIACTTDIEKAFDTVWKEGLVHKMRNVFNFNDHLCRCIHHLLRDRTFEVKVNNVVSDRFEVAAGVPQGGVLSAILYVIYTADMPQPPNHNNPIRRLQYADDMLIYISAKNLTMGQHRINSYLSDIVRYMTKWKIKINPNKCEAIVFKGLNKHFSNAINAAHNNVMISINGTTLVPQRTLKYLGIIFQKNLSETAHVKHIRGKVNGAFASLRTVLNQTSKMNIQVKTLCYKQLIRPIIMYGFSCWSNLSSSQMERIRTLERMCLRACTKSRVPGSYKYINNTVLYNTTKIERIDRVLVRQALQFLNRPQDDCELIRTCCNFDPNYLNNSTYKLPWHLMHLHINNGLYENDTLMFYHRRFNQHADLEPVYNTKQ